MREDVVQDAFLHAFRYLDTFCGDNFRAWLLPVVTNRVLDWLNDNGSGCRLF